jgi:hypothetical protein
MAQGNSPYFLQGLVDVFGVVFHGEVVCAAKDYGPVVGIVWMGFLICIGFSGLERLRGSV